MVGTAAIGMKRMALWLRRPDGELHGQRAFEKNLWDVILKPGAFCRAEESAFISIAREKSIFFASLRMTSSNYFSTACQRKRFEPRPAAWLLAYGCGSDYSGMPMRRSNSPKRGSGRRGSNTGYALRKHSGPKRSSQSLLSNSKARSNSPRAAQRGAVR